MNNVAKINHYSHFSQRTVVVTPPDCGGLPQNEIYEYVFNSLHFPLLTIHGYIFMLESTFSTPLL